VRSNSAHSIADLIAAQPARRWSSAAMVAAISASSRPGSAAVRCSSTLRTAAGGRSNGSSARA
jgi:hypothetical protein